MSKIQNVKVTGMEIVVQDNRLIDSPRFFSLQEQRLFIFLVSKLNPKNREDITFRFPTIEFSKAIEIDPDTAIRDLKRITKKIMGLVVELKNKDEKSTTYTHIVSYAKYWEGKGYADFKISDEIAPYLFDMKERYTSYKLTQVTRLSSIYAIRIYEVLKQYENLKKRSFFIDDLRKKLAIKESQYSRFNDFRKYVLEIAKKEINEKTDLKVDYTLQKTGKKFTVIDFSIVAKDGKNQIQNYEIPRYYDQNIVDKMISIGMSEKTAKDWFERYSTADIENAIKVVDQNIESGKCDNSVAMLKTAIQKRWKPKIKDSDVESISFNETSDVEEKELQKAEQKKLPTSKKKKPQRKTSGSFLQKLFSIFDSCIYVLCLAMN
jgi:plasmid replication initiation protein